MSIGKTRPCASCQWPSRSPRWWPGEVLTPLHQESANYPIAAQVLHDALRLRIGPVAEVGAKSIVRGESHVIRSRDNDIGDDTAFEAAHAVSQDLGRPPADRLERFGDHR